MCVCCTAELLVFSSCLWCEPPLISRQAVSPPAPLCSCHCTPHHTYYSLRTNSLTHMPNTHIHSKHTTNTAAYKSLYTSLSSSWLTFTHTQFYLLTRRPHGLAANKGEKYPLTLPPKTPNALCAPRIPPAKSALAPILPQEYRWERRLEAGPRSSASSWGSSLLKLGAASGHQPAALPR